MDDFVNYKKRSVNLPLGCKDLIDVLRRRQERRSQKFPDRLIEAVIAEEIKRLTQLEKE